MTITSLSHSWSWRKCFQFSNMKNDVSCRFVYNGLYYIEMFPFCPLSRELFIINVCWIVSKAFSASVEIIICFLFFSLLVWCITLIDLLILKKPCIPGINPTWSWRLILLMYYWIWLASTLLNVIASIFIINIDL